jgi:hypothetical protein
MSKYYINNKIVLLLLLLLVCIIIYFLQSKTIIEIFSSPYKNGDQCTQDITFKNKCGREETIKCQNGYYLCGPCGDCLGKGKKCCPGTLKCGSDGVCQPP